MAETFDLAAGLEELELELEGPGGPAPAKPAPEPALGPAPSPAPGPASEPAPASPEWRCLQPRAPPAADVRGAWVALVMRGDAYVPGALVTAQSLRRVRTRHALVCMVTADVTDGAREDLGRLYDCVVEVPYLRGQGGELGTLRQTELYGAWIAVSFTKWNCLGLTDWTKVVFVDADVLFLVNCDDLFDLPPPAACFASPWALPWSEGGLPNPYLDGGSPLAHGARVGPGAVRRGLRENGFVASASLVVLGPGAGLMERLRALLVLPVPSLRGSGADEVALARLFGAEKTAWAHIHPRYLTIPWKRCWSDVRAFHYQGRKPWDTPPAEWPDLWDWWDVARGLARACPGLRCAGRLVPPAAPPPGQSLGPAGGRASQGSRPCEADARRGAGGPRKGRAGGRRAAPTFPRQNNGLPERPAAEPPVGAPGPQPPQRESRHPRQRVRRWG